MRANLMIAVRSRPAFSQFSDVVWERPGGDVLIVQPTKNDPSIAYKGMLQQFMFARRHVRRNLRAVWEQGWAAVGRTKPAPSGWDVDHVFPVCWAEKSGFEYVLMQPVHRRPNRSAGAGVEKSAKNNDQLIAQYVDIEVQGDKAYLGLPAVSKLMNVAPGPGSQQYPGLEQIKPDLKKLEALLAL